MDFPTSFLFCTECITGDISLTVIVCYANDCEGATVRIVCRKRSVAVRFNSYSHGLRPILPCGMHDVEIALTVCRNCAIIVVFKLKGIVINRNVL